MEVARQHDEDRGRARVASSGRLWLIVGPVALLAGLAAGAIVLTGRESPAVAVALIPAIGWAFVAAGLVAWSREPLNRIGPLMVATGFAWFFAALMTSDVALLFTAGLFLFPLCYAFLVHLLLAYPSGRLAGRWDAVVVTLGYLATTLFRLPWILLQAYPNDVCDDCPANRLLVADEPTLATVFDVLSSAVGVALLVYVVVSFVRRWRSASPRSRRALAPVLVSGGAWLLTLVVLLALEPFWSPVADVAQWILFALLLSVPVAFLVGLMRSRLATVGASRAILEAASTSTPQESQEGLRRALGDPTLELAYWLPERGAYVDTAGDPFELPPPGQGRMTTPIAYGQRPVAALVHDESLRHEPELVEAVVAAVRVALERDRLAAELRARLAELRRERDFVATVVNTAPALFCVVDLEGRILRFNTTGEGITGFVDGDSVRGRPFWEVFVPPEEAEPLRLRLAAAAEAGGSPETETEITTAGGARRVLAWSSTPIVDAQGEPRLLISGVDVTDRRQQALELERERDFGHAVTDTTPSFLVVVDDEGRIADGGVNNACEDAVGRPEAELVGQRFVNVFVPPEERATVIEKLAEAGHGATVEYEGRWLGREGTELWVAWSCRPLRGEGRRRSFLVCGTDITERRRSEQELQRQRDALRTIANAAPSFMAVVDERGRFAQGSLNDAFQRVLGYSDDEVASRELFELVLGPEDVEDARALFRRSVASRAPIERDSSWVTRSGERRRVAWSATWIAGADDGGERFLVCGTDVTEREQQAAELQRERDVLNTIANTAPSLMLIVDQSGRLTAESLNATARHVLGYEDAEVVGRDFIELVVAPEETAIARERFARFVASGESPELDSTWVTCTGDRVQVAWSARWLSFADDEVRQLYLVSGVDVSERKRQEDELRASRARIVEAADAERRRLERNLHDGAQQRLVTLSLSLRLAESRLGADADAVALLRGARDELAQALDELRDLARGIHPAVLSDHGLAAALDALASRVPLPVEIRRGLPARLPEPVEVAAYYVVSESLANVQKYARATYVQIGVQHENGHAVVEVSDDGVGGADAGEGSGLRGLADRVEALGGRLEVESPAGAGTTVRARIPVR